MNYQLKTIGEIFGDVKIGGTPARERTEYFGGGIPWVSIKDMGKGKYVSETNETLSESGVQNSNVKLIKKGSLLFSFKLTVGRMCFAGTDLYTNEAIAAFEPNPEIMLEYLYYILPVATKQVKRTNNFGAPLLNKDQIKKLRIPLPPLKTQKAIVAKLDQIFAELDQTKSEIQKNLDNTDELWKSTLNQAFQGDWEMKKLGEMAEIQNGGTPKTEKKEYWDGDILWITPKDMGELNSRYVDDTSRKISNLGLSNSSAKLLPIKSVILSSRAPIGYVAINTKPISTNQGCKGIIPNDNLKAEYLYYFLILSNKLLNSLGSGATFKELSSSKLGEVEIPVPPLSEQEKIVEHLDQISKEVKALKSQYQSQLDNLEELKKSVLDKAFRGEIVE